MVHKYCFYCVIKGQVNKRTLEEKPWKTWKPFNLPKVFDVTRGSSRVLYWYFWFIGHENINHVKDKNIVRHSDSYLSFDNFSLGGIQKLCWQDFAHYCPPTYLLVDICDGISVLKVQLFWDGHKNLCKWFWCLLSKFKNHKDDYAHFCGLLRKAELHC